jgi:hypothetical protein
MPSLSYPLARRFTICTIIIRLRIIEGNNSLQLSKSPPHLSSLALLPSASLLSHKTITCNAGLAFNLSNPGISHYLLSLQADLAKPKRTTVVADLANNGFRQ